VTGRRLTASEASALLDARLSRPAQDRLEAAVVLEAWGGVSGDDAFTIAESATRMPARSDGRVRRRVVDGDAAASAVAEFLPLTLAILAIAAWTGPLTDEFGVSVVERALLVALPGTLSIQWLLRGRHFADRRGVGSLPHDVWVLAAGLAALAVLPFLGVSGEWALGGLLVAAWVAGTVLARCGLGFVYAGLVGVAALMLAAGHSAIRVLTTTDLALVALVVLAVSPARQGAEAPLAWRRIVAPFLLGAGLGAALVLDPSIGWGIHGSAPAFALLPSAVGSFWASHRLSRLGAVIPLSLDGAPVAESDRGSLASPGMRLFVGAVARMAVCIALLSLALFSVQAWLEQPSVAPVLVGVFAAVSLLFLLIGLLDALGSRRFGLVAVAATLAVESSLPYLHPASYPGEAALLAASAGIVMALGPLLYQLFRSGRMLSTVLWIR
jgi:hypothetical protein